MVADGAMGTMLIARGFSSDHCLEELNLLHPATIQAVHQSYLAAGARMIETNTFGANRFALAEYGLEEKVVRINQSAVRIAREAREVFGQPVFIAGSVGPTGRVLEPFGKLASGEAQDAFRNRLTCFKPPPWTWFCWKRSTTSMKPFCCARGEGSRWLARHRANGVSGG